MFEGTIDWDAYWRGEVDGGSLGADRGDEEKRQLLETFFDRTKVPDSFASIGCGAGTLVAALDRQYPAMSVWGFDAAESVIDRNRSVYADRSNLTFEVATLPDLDIDRNFDLVYCYATLHYVREIERALEDLYGIVAPGGYLVVNYPNEGSQTSHQENTEEGSPMYRRFKLVYHGENLLTRERIAKLLNAEVHDYWDYVGAPDTYWTQPGNPCVYVEKAE